MLEVLYPPTSTLIFSAKTNQLVNDPKPHTFIIIAVWNMVRSWSGQKFHY